MSGTKLLTDSTIYQAFVAQMAAAIVAQTNTSIKTSLGTALLTLPNEANGDTIPTQGPYLTGSGIVKVATGS